MEKLLIARTVTRLLQPLMKVTRMAKRKQKLRKIWLVEPVERQAEGGLSRAVVTGVTKKEVEDLLFANYDGERFKLKFEELATLDWSICSYVVCVQLIPAESKKEESNGV
jgi:hypothetical protein